MAQSKVSSMAEGKGDNALRAATGKSWDQWNAILKAAGAAKWSHPEMARWVEEHYEVGGWWAQGITIGFEQAIGRRLPGQRSDGTFEVSATRTLASGLLDALDAIEGVVNVELGIEPTSQSREVKMPSVRWKLEDAERLQAMVTTTKPGKVSVSLTHSKMNAAEQVEPARQRMKDWLARVS